VGVVVNDADPDSHAVVVVWLVAVLVEQGASIYLLNYCPCDFDANYYGERMCTWIMLAFGESVISLLNLTFTYTVDMVVTSCACFVFIAFLCIHYFDVVDGDQ
jgi:low temperature requirement protein LtrA